MRVLKRQRKELEEHFNESPLSLFGSVACDEAGVDSDLDLLVEFSEPVGLFPFIELQQRLEELQDYKVDLSTLRSLKPRIKDQVLREVIRVA